MGSSPTVITIKADETSVDPDPHFMAPGDEVKWMWPEGKRGRIKFDKSPFNSDTLDYETASNANRAREDVEEGEYHYCVIPEKATSLGNDPLIIIKKP